MNLLGTLTAPVRISRTAIRTAFDHGFTGSVVIDAIVMGVTLVVSLSILFDDILSHATVLLQYLLLGSLSIETLSSLGLLILGPTLAITGLVLLAISFLAFCSLLGYGLRSLS